MAKVSREAQDALIMAAVATQSIPLAVVTLVYSVFQCPGLRYVWNKRIWLN